MESDIETNKNSALHIFQFVGKVRGVPVWIFGSML